jgi:nicotinamidase-related amidase
MSQALILIETQNEWLHEKGKLVKLMEDKSLYENSKKGIVSALDIARKSDMHVIHVGLRFQKGYPELANGKSGLRKAIPKVGTFPLDEFGSQFHESGKPQEGEFIVTGRTGGSGFAGSNLDIYLRNNQIFDIYLAGYATHVCVESTLREAHDKGYNTTLLSDACSAFTKEQQRHVLDHVVHHYGEAMTVAEFDKKILQSE